MAIFLKVEETTEEVGPLQGLAVFISGILIVVGLVIIDKNKNDAAAQLGGGFIILIGLIPMAYFLWYIGVFG